MLILGIDPSLRYTGLAILDTDLHHILYTRTIRTSRIEPMQFRLDHIYSHIREIIALHQIREVAIETQYMGRYAAALKIAMAYAACLLACEHHDHIVRIGHYSPACIKKNIARHGRADKKMVIEAVRCIYPHPTLASIDSHMADAIALAHIHQQLL